MFWHKRKQADFSEEIRAHLELETQRLKEQGLSDEEARVAAYRAFGNVTRAEERFYESSRWVWFDHLAQDVRFGLRQLRKTPAFTAIAVLTLALGIGANTTIFSAVSAILLRKPAVRDPDELYTVSSKNLLEGSDLQEISALDFESWKEPGHVFDDMAAAATGHSFTLTGQGEPAAIDGDRVTTNYFSVVGVMPALGRAFLPAEAQTGNDHVVILSDALWHERFGSDPNVIGKVIKLDLEPHTIVGVMPPGSAIPMPWIPPRLWTPLVFTARDLKPSARGDHNLNMVLARLKPGVRAVQAQAEMDSIAQLLRATYPQTNKDWGVTVLTLQEYLIQKPRTRSAMLMLMVMVAFVLLIACANIAGLLLARGAGRAHEMAVRAAVGANRKRLIVQMLVESLLIGVAGGAAGLILSVWGIDLLRAGFNFNEIGRQMARSFHLDHETFLFTAAISLLTTLLSGLAPAVRASKINPGDALSEGGRTGSGGFARSRMRSVLVTGEVALALALLSGAAIMAREIHWELSQELGFDQARLLLAEINLKSQQYQKPDAQIAFFQQVTQKLRELPGVETADGTLDIPLGNAWNTSFSIVGQPVAEKSRRPSADYFVVGPEYFRAMKIPLMKGREFSLSDNTHSPVVAIVSQEFVRRFFPNADAIGQQIETEAGDNQRAQIVGIVGNVSTYIGQSEPHPQIYRCYLQIPYPNLTLIARSRLAASALAPMLREVVWTVDKDQPVGRIKTMNELAADNEGGDKLMVALMGIFAGLALILAAVGIYGLVAYSMSQRTREIGIRMALGAQRKDVLQLVLRQGGLLAGIGCALGLVLALPLPRVFAAMFQGFPLQGPLVAIVVTALIAVVSFLATYIPARRATKVDPTVALRYE
jgi:putative ABC transport system permease protein